MTHAIHSKTPALDPTFNESLASIGIERFVKSIEEGMTWNGIYLFAGDDLKEMRLITYRAWLRVYHPDYQYSEHLDAFWYACMKLDLLPLDRNCPVALAAASEVIDQRFDELGIAIVQYLYSSEFKRAKSDRRYQAGQNRVHVQQELYSLLMRYSRVLAVRTDFGYRKDYLDQICITDVDQHVKTFVKELKKRSEFEKLKLYARKIEQGKDRGYHIHFAAYFNGDDHWNGWYMANLLGKLWEEITDGMGSSHNCNRNESEYEAVGIRGIGMIHRKNLHECNNAINAISYLTDPEKFDQHLRVRMANQRSFAISQFNPE